MASGTTQPGFQDAFKQYQDECQNECDIIKFMIMWYLNFRQIKLSNDENRDLLGYFKSIEPNTTTLFINKHKKVFNLSINPLPDEVVVQFETESDTKHQREVNVPYKNIDAKMKKIVGSMETFQEFNNALIYLRIIEFQAKD